MTGYGLDDHNLILGRAGIFVFATVSKLTLALTQLLVHWVPGELFSGLKLPEHQADHSPPSYVEVKNEDLPPLPHTSSRRDALTQGQILDSNLCLFVSMSILYSTLCSDPEGVSA
jgi:hypothetical protein